jgi:hypothetical protein
MNDFLSRLAEHAQSRTQVAEPLIPSRFAASPWPNAGDVATPVLGEHPERGPARASHHASERNSPPPQPHEPTEPGEQLETSMEARLHRPIRPVQARPSSSPATHLQDVPSGPGSPSVLPTTADPGDAPKDGKNSPGLPLRSRPLDAEETESESYGTEGHLGIPEPSRTPLSSTRTGAEHVESLPHSIPWERDTAGPDQRGHGGDTAARPPLPDVEPYDGGETRLASPRIENTAGRRPPPGVEPTDAVEASLTSPRTDIGDNQDESLPHSIPWERDTAGPDQRGHGGDTAARPPLPDVEPNDGGETRLASPRIDIGDNQDESRQGSPRGALEQPSTSSLITPAYVTGEGEVRTSTGARRVPDPVVPSRTARQHATAGRKAPEDVEVYAKSGMEVPPTAPPGQVPDEESAPPDGRLPDIERRPPRREPTREQPARGQLPDLFAGEPSWSQAPWAEHVESRRPAQQPPLRPTVRVTIGRIEVRAVQPQAPPEARSSKDPRGPRITLDDYLKERSGGGS